MFCIKCGNEFKEDMKFCPKCGAEVPAGGNKKKSGRKKIFFLFALIPIIFLLLVIVASFSDTGNADVNTNKTADTDDLKQNTSTNEGTSDEIEAKETKEKGADFSISAKKEDGTVINDFNKINDKLYVSADYEEYDFQCPYEVVLEKRDFGSYDRIYLIEHLVEESRVTEDSDGNRIKQVEGVTHYFLDAIRVMCEYTTDDNLLTVKKYYNLCMTNFGQESYDTWNDVTCDYVGQDEELSYNNLNDTYWCIEGNDFACIERDYLASQGVYSFDVDKVTTYLHFHDFDKVQIDEIEGDDGTFAVSYMEEYEMCSVKVVYEDNCVEEELFAGDVESAFVKAIFSENNGLKLEIGMHRKANPDSYAYSRGLADDVIYTEGNSGNYNNLITQITKEEYDNASGHSADKSVSADSYSDDELCEMARQYMKNSGLYDNPMAGVESTDGNMVKLCLYDYYDNRQWGCGYYSVDRNTGKGYDDSGNQIDLTQVYQENNSANSVNNAKNSEYIIEGSDSGYFEESYLEGFTAEECRLARNEIYARHGKIFKDEALQEYFNSKSWYTPEYEDVPNSMLNDWELANIDTIVNYEKAMGYR